MKTNPINGSRGEFIGVWVFALACALFGILTGGCASAPVQQPSLTSANSTMARIGVRADVITQQAKTVQPGLARDTIIEQAGQTKADAVLGAAQLDKTNTEIQLMAGTIHQDAIDKAELHARIDEGNKAIIGPRGKLWLIGISAVISISSVLAVAAYFFFSEASLLPHLSTAIGFIRSFLPARGAKAAA